MRISKTAASKVANEPLEEWFSLLGDSHMSTKLKLYAQVRRTDFFFGAGPTY